MTTSPDAPPGHDADSRLAPDSSSRPLDATTTATSDLIQDLVRDPIALELRDDLDSLVPSFAPADFVRIAHGLADDQRLELLLPHATADQLTGLLDLDAWEKDRVDVFAARQWLHAIARYRRESPSSDLGELVLAMDPEMWTFALVHGTAIAEVDLDDDGSRDDILETMSALRIWEVPSGEFIVGVRDDAFGHMALDILSAMADEDLDLLRRMLQSIKFAIASQIEEDLFRWRTGRLADLGFPTWEEAMELLRPLALPQYLGQPIAREESGETDSDDRDRHADPSLPPATALALGWRPSHGMLRAVIDRMDPRQHGISAREFGLLANELLIAQRFEPRDDEQRQRALAQAEATLELGCQLVARALPEEPAELRLLERIAASGLRQLFRVGYAPLAKLRNTALSLHRAGRVSVASIGSFLDRPWGPMLEHLARWYPEMPPEAREAQSPPDPFAPRPKRAPDPRPIASLAELATATRRLAEAGALVQLTFDAHGLAVDPTWLTRADEPERLRIGDFVRTSLLCAALADSDRTGFRPLSGEDLARARNQFLDDRGRLAPDVARRLTAVCERAGIRDHEDALREPLLTRLEVELAALEFIGAQVDLTRVGGILTTQHFGVWIKTGLDAVDQQRPAEG